MTQNEEDGAEAGGPDKAEPDPAEASQVESPPKAVAPAEPTLPGADQAFSWDWRWALSILLLALLLRGATLVRAPLIGADSARFLAAAKSFEEDQPVAAFADAYHPLTSYLISRVNLLSQVVFGQPGDPVSDRIRREWAAHLVSLFCGLVLVGLLMDLSRRAFPQVSPWAVGLLAACQPYLVRSAADVMSDSLFLALFLYALRQAYRLVGTERRASWAAAITAGGAVGASYLTRPEGLVLFGVIPVFWLWFERRRLGFAFSRIVGFLVAVSLLAVPYALTISTLSGSPTLTMKKKLGATTGWITVPSLDQALDPAVFRGSVLGDINLEVLGEVFFRWFSTCPEAFAVPCILGLWLISRRRESAVGLALFGLASAGMGFVLLRLVSVTGPGYLSRRHVLTLVTLSLPFVALALGRVGAWLFRRLDGRRAAILGWIPLAVVCVGVIPKAVKAQRQNQVAQKLVGGQIYARHGTGTVVFSSREKVAYYALGHLYSLASNSADTKERAMRWPRSWVVFYREVIYADDPAGFERDWGDLPPGLTHFGRYPEPHSSSGRSLEVFLWERPRAPGGG